MIETFPIRTVEKPDRPREGWAVFHEPSRWPDRPERVFGPANLYDCVLARNRMIDDLRHGPRR